MPLAAAVAVAGVASAGASMIGASKASKAASKAADQNAQIQREQNAQARADLAPYAGAGNVATQALMQRLGLAAPAATTQAPPSNNTISTIPNMTFGGYGGNDRKPQGTPLGAGGPQKVGPGDGPVRFGSELPNGAMGGEAPQAALQAAATGQPDYAAYVQNNPDLIALYNEHRGMAKGKSIEQFGQEHYQGYGQNEGRTVPGLATTQQAAPQTVPDQPGANGPSTIPGQTFTSSDNGGLGARADMSRQPFTEQQPTIGQGPSSAQYVDPANFQTSPGYEFRLNEGQRNLNANSAARGLAKSGYGIKGAINYGQGAASAEYGNWFNQQMQRLGADQNQFNTDRGVGLNQYNQNRNVFDQHYAEDTARNDNIFESDRGYNTNRYDAYTGNLFNLANQGQAAAAGQANAGQNYAAAATANNNSLASVKGNAAIAGANGISSAINGAAQAFGAYSNPFATYGRTPAVNGVSYNFIP